MISQFFGLKSTISKVNIICEGDSLTVGQGLSYPSQLLSMIKITDKHIVNYGVNGQQSAAMKTNISSHCDSSYLAGYKNICIIQIGVNDIYYNAALSVTIQNILDSATIAKNKGFTVLVNTTTPFSMTNTGAAFDALYSKTIQLNQLIRNNKGVYDFIDIANDPYFNYQNAVYQTNVYQNDETHLTNEGYNRIAKLDYKKLNTLKIR